MRGNCVYSCMTWYWFLLGLVQKSVKWQWIMFKTGLWCLDMVLAACVSDVTLTLHCLSIFFGRLEEIFFTLSGESFTSPDYCSGRGKARNMYCVSLTFSFTRTFLSNSVCFWYMDVRVGGHAQFCFGFFSFVFFFVCFGLHLAAVLCVWCECRFL